MKTVLALAVASSLTLLPAHATAAAAEVGKPAPEFTALDTNGNSGSLQQTRGRWVVLEWLNHDCPYVKKYYDSGAMQALQRKWAAEGVVWVSVVSSAPGKQGYYSNERANEINREKEGAAHAILVDSSGAIGRAYDARTTPHMFVINPDGILVYMGAIDDRPTARRTDLEGARVHLDIALQEAMAGKPVSVPTTKPYGCNVKY